MGVWDDIDMSNFDGGEKEPNKKLSQLLKRSHNKLVANYYISERNKDKSFREKVSKGVSKFFGDPTERFFSNVEKLNDGCWIYKKRWFTFEKKDLQPKE